MVRLHIADKKGEFNTFKYDPKTGELTPEEKTQWAEYVQTLAREQKLKYGDSTPLPSHPAGRAPAKPVVTDGVALLNTQGQVVQPRIKRVRK
ncbi:Uncharacterised protein [uncultured archaeon]|nr:Uncharacterised protein [uncultured archaeon]